MANVTLWGATYSNVPSIEVPKSGGGTASFTDITDTTATASDVASGKVFYLSDGTRTTGTASGGGSMNTQIAQSTTRVASTSYQPVVSMTCTTAGTYDVYWSGHRSSTSGSWGTQLYIGGSAYGYAQTSFTNHIQNVHLTGVQIAANQTVAVYARSRGSSYYAYVGTLTIKQTA